MSGRVAVQMALLTGNFTKIHSKKKLLFTHALAEGVIAQAKLQTAGFVPYLWGVEVDLVRTIDRVVISLMHMNTICKL